MDWSECLAGVAIGQSGVDQELEEEDNDLDQLVVCVVEWERYREKIDSNPYLIGGSNVESRQRQVCPALTSQRSMVGLREILRCYTQCV